MSTLPAKLPGLTDREAITDTLYRAVLAFDHADESLLLSAVTEDISVEMRNSSFQGIETLKSTLFNRVSALDTTHFLSNIRISWYPVDDENDKMAKVTCSALAQHVRPGKGFEPGPNKFMTGGFYVCDVVKVDDLWKIKSWKANIVWVDGDPSVMAGP